MRNSVIKLALLAAYPLLLLRRVAAIARHRDPLRHRNPEGSCWIERPPPAPARSYFSSNLSAARLRGPAALLALVARAVARSRRDRAEPAAQPRGLGSDVPDEIYTLW